MFDSKKVGGEGDPLDGNSGWEEVESHFLHEYEMDKDLLRVSKW